MCNNVAKSQAPGTYAGLGAAARPAGAVPGYHSRYDHLIDYQAVSTLETAEIHPFRGPALPLGSALGSGTGVAAAEVDRPPSRAAAGRGGARAPSRHPALIWDVFSQQRYLSQNFPVR